MEHIRRAVHRIMLAYEDALSDPSSYVARDLRELARQSNNMDADPNPCWFEVHASKFDTAFNTLALSGYIVKG